MDVLNKKIVICSNTSFSVYNFRLGLIKVLKEKGYEVNVVAPVDEFTDLIEKEVKVYPITHLDRKGKNPIKDFRLLHEFYSLYKSIKPDLVINYTIKPNIYSSIACGILSIPSISVITGLGHVFIKQNMLTSLVKSLYRVAFKFNSYIFMLNEDDIKIIDKLTTMSKIRLIKGEGINVEYFSPKFCQEEKNVNKNFTFLFIGRLIKEKGVLELIEAGKSLAKERKDFEIWLLGSLDYGNPSSLSEKEIHSIKSLDFIKPIPFSKDVRPYICASDCVVLPSYYKEGVPRSLLEAMAMEKPIITTDSTGCRDVCLDGVNGFLVKPKDVESLYEAMKKMLEMSKEEISKLGKEGRKIVLQEFSEEIIIKEYEKIIDRMIGR